MSRSCRKRTNHALLLSTTSSCCCCCYYLEVRAAMPRDLLLRAGAFPLAISTAGHDPPTPFSSTTSHPAVECTRLCRATFPYLSTRLCPYGLVVVRHLANIYSPLLGDNSHIFSPARPLAVAAIVGYARPRQAT